MLNLAYYFRIRKSKLNLQNEIGIRNRYELLVIRQSDEKREFANSMLVKSSFNFFNCFNFPVCLSASLSGREGGECHQLLGPRRPCLMFLCLPRTRGLDVVCSSSVSSLSLHACVLCASHRAHSLVCIRPLAQLIMNRLPSSLSTPSHPLRRMGAHSNGSQWWRRREYCARKVLPIPSALSN